MGDSNTGFVAEKRRRLGRWVAEPDRERLPLAIVNHPVGSQMEFDRMRPHQVHLEGGDASSDSYCFA